MNGARCRGLSLLLVGVLVISSPLAWSSHDYLFERDYFEISELQLISHYALAGTEAQRGPVCSAILLAWFAEHGYPELLGDKNGDGVVDERDTEFLAMMDLATQMCVAWDIPASDARLFHVLARYVAERYPDEFSIKLFDDSFAREYGHVFRRPFDPEDYDGIEVELMRNATRDDYVNALLEGAGVIVGLGREWTWEPQIVERSNEFFVGRSFGDAEYGGEWLVDLVDSREDPWNPGVGQVLDTRMRRGPSGSDYWFVMYSGWEPLEFMLVLAPVRTPALEETPPPDGCLCEDVINTQYGRFIVCVEVDRQEDRDCYTYTITNMDYLCDGCGICSFYVPNVFNAFSTLSQWGPPGWWINPFGHAWHWEAQMGNCGILPGESAQMGFCVPGPTTVDESHSGAVWGCPAAFLEEPPCLSLFETCGPSPDYVPTQQNGDCTYSIRPTSWSAGNCGDSVFVHLTTQDGCGWTATSNNDWLTAHPTSGTGSASVRVFAVSNNTGSPRNGSVTFSGFGWTETLHVSQDPCKQETPCTYSINPTSWQFSSRGGSVTVNITTQPGCRWTATSPCGWVTVSPGSGSGSGSVTVSVDTWTTGGGSRSCTLTIAGRSFVVYQSSP